MVDKEKARRIAEHYGAWSQICKSVEELIELSEVLIKGINKPKVFDKDSLYEEMADVEIMLEQLKLIFSIDEEILQNGIDAKIERTILRMGEEQ